MNPARRIPLILMASLFVLGGAAMPIFGKPEDRLFLVGMGSVLALFGAGFYWLLDRTRIRVSPSGVRVRYLWLRLETPWIHVESLRMDRGQEAFITASPMEGGGPRQMASMGGGPAYDATARQWMALRRYIPIEGFSWHLRHSLGEDVRRFAPHLQAALDAGAPPPDPATTKVKWPLVILLTALVVAAVLLPSIIAPDLMHKGMNIVWLIVTPLFAIQSGWTAVRAFRRKSILVGILASLFSILMALWTLAIIGMMTEPGKTGPSQAKTPSPASGATTNPKQ